MAVSDIRHTIATAVAQEQKSCSLRRRLNAKLPQIQERLELPEDEPLESLMTFIIRYVESVPGSISLVTAVSKQLGFYDYAALFLNIAEDYFIDPPQDLPEDGGLALLLDEAFLAHRLLEEVNDHHIRHLQRPLLPVDMTEANIIVHHLLGEGLANRLEQLVQYTASRLLEKEHIWERVRDLPGSATFSEPPICSAALSDVDHAVRLRLGA
ncbi:MAG: hypothetical protein ABJ013_11390 [Halioglobus sp.]